MPIRPRSRRPGVQKAPAGPLRWTLLIAFALAALALWLGFLLLAVCFVVPVFGEPSGLALGASALVGLGAPLALALWMVRPLDGLRRLAWFVGSFAAIPLLALAGLSLGAPRSTAEHLRRWAKPAVERVLGKTTRSAAARAVVDAAQAWADLMHPQPRARHARARPPRGQKTHPSRRVGARKDLFFAGLARPRLRPASYGAGPLDGVLPLSRRLARHRGRKRGRKSVVRFVRKGGAIHLAAKARATFRRRIALLLDTGASLSTLTRQAAKSLGISLPRVPVEVELETASGKHGFPLAILPSLTVGRARVDNLTVAICDACTPSGLHGLLGLNFTQHFQVGIDPRARTLTLRPLAKPWNRIYDIEPFLEFSEVHGQIVGKRFVLQGHVRNQSPRRVRDLRLEAHLLDSQDKRLRRAATLVPRLAPGKSVSFAIEGPGHSDGVRYRLVPVSARW